jgi:hypothetical protein
MVGAFFRPIFDEEGDKHAKIITFSVVSSGGATDEFLGGPG